MKLITIAICADANNYYDRAAHPFTSLCMQNFRLDDTCLVALFIAIQSTQMFLRVSHSTCKNHCSENNEKPFKGVV